MKIIYKYIFKLITDPLSLSIDPIWEYLIMLLIGIIAFKIAWEISPGGEFGSLIHWTTRIGVFVVLHHVVDIFIMAVRWVKGNVLCAILIAVGIVAVTTAVLVFKHKFNNTLGVSS